MGTVNKEFLFKGKTISKLLVILFAALLCSVLVLATADDSAASPGDEFEFDGINYVVTSEDTSEPFDGSVKVLSYTSASGDLAIPNQVTNGDPVKTYGVTSIDQEAFNHSL